MPISPLMYLKMSNNHHFVCWYKIIATTTPNLFQVPLRIALMIYQFNGKKKNALRQDSNVDIVAENNTTKQRNNKRRSFIPIATNVAPYHKTDKHFITPLINKYLKVLEILNNAINENSRSSICLRMGGFHAYCIFLTVFGKLFRSAGPGTSEQLLNGKHCNHGIRVVKTIFKALVRLKFSAFCD